MNPRPYQQLSIDKIVKGFDEFDRQLLVLPTGGGKTLVFSWLAKTFLPRRTLILAHREELIDQAIAKLRAATGIIAEKEKAEFRASKMADVVVASVQSMIRRLDNWAPDHFGLVVADEAHHSISDSWAKVLNHFTGAKILGVTATPDRSDVRNLGVFYQNIPHQVTLIDLIKERFLCPVTIRSVPLKIDLNTVKQVAGDYDAAGLDSAITPYFNSIAEAVKQHAPGRKVLVFLPLIATSKAFTQTCLEHGLRARHVDGMSENRREILDSFARNEFDVLCNAMLLTEGYDDPSINCIVNLRPTRSRALYAQIAGRGTRICDGKKDLLLLDFLFLHERLELVRPASLIAKDDDEAESMTDLAFEKAEGGEPEQDLIELAGAARSDREEKLKEKLAALAKRQAKFISAEEFAMRHHQLDLAEWQPTMHWHEAAITDKQKEWLEKGGIDPETVRGKGHASELLDIVFKESGRLPATSGQKWVLRQNGFRSPDGLRDWSTATQNDARQFFTMRNKKKAAVAA